MTPRYFKSNLEFDPGSMLQEFEFFNIKSIHYCRMRRVETRTEELLKQTEKILELMKTAFNKNES